MAKDRQETIQEAVENDKANCTHIGYFVGYGSEVLPMNDGTLICVCFINCIMCGMQFVTHKELKMAFEPEQKPKATMVIPGKQ